MRSALDSGSGGPGSSPGEVTTTGSSTEGQMGLVWGQVFGSSNLSYPTKYFDVLFVTGCGAVGSAPGLGPGGRRFESCYPDNRSAGIKQAGLGTCTFLNSCPTDLQVTNLVCDNNGLVPEMVYGSVREADC